MLPEVLMVPQLAVEILPRRERDNIIAAAGSFLVDLQECLMPTAFPFRLPPVRRLTLLETVQFLVLIVLVRWLDRRLHAAHRRVDRRGLGTAGDELLQLARRWLDIHQQIGGLLGISQLPHVAQVRIALQSEARIFRARP